MIARGLLSEEIGALLLWLGSRAKAAESSHLSVRIPDDCLRTARGAFGLVNG